ncbi:hypothetical protein PGT21_036338 [Puccinia graminis f. sp. tritici]|uniref:Uncharacterized protein n=1 Tax=Puccinia graminis f. sp. tritici TaxID=56615 RepID=A0A5B0NSG0_PUCGR|nr:hypothetical protein PGTUg99_037534 [Puccinia graminis f. sp. tritici]KAA1091622.1 hypothetical protein PGT21_036338 [Puccinia graminis f. sp. tritici]
MSTTTQPPWQPQASVAYTAQKRVTYTPGALLAERDRGADESQPIHGTHKIGSVAAADSLVAAQQASSLAPRDNLGMHPWTKWWSPQRNTKDRQILVRPPAGATHGIHGENQYRPTPC